MKELIAGKSGIKLHQPFPELGLRPLGLIGTQPAQVRMLTQLVIASALKDAELVPPMPTCGIVIGSSRSHQGEWEQMLHQMQRGVGKRRSAGTSVQIEGVGEETFRRNVCTGVGEEITPSSPLFPSSSPTPPLSWLETLPHMNAIAAARQIGASGVVLAPMVGCATGIWAIAQAALLVQTGQCQQVISGAIEAPITTLTITGFQQMGALATTGAYAFDLQRSGFVLGEGAAVFVLESAEFALQRQAKVYGQILGFGLTADAYHSNSPQPEGKSAIAAVKQCLERSHLTPGDIDYIHAHGTATQLNDRIESLVIQRLFSHKVAVSSTKGSTGHTLGASGALGVAFSLMALKHQILPPCVGLRHPEFDLNLVRAARHSAIKNVLCFSFGFGGQNAVIALAK